MAADKVRHSCRKVFPGFSLLELVIVLAVMAVLLTIAVPSYLQYVQRVERADAVRLLLGMADCQERIRMNTGFYDTTRCIDGLDNEAYSFLIKPAGDTSSIGFEVVAEPGRGRGNDCGSLSLDHTGARGISSEKGVLSACWGGR